MTVEDIEKIFNRAFSKAFCRKKNFFLFPVLFICGMIIEFSNTFLGRGSFFGVFYPFVSLFLSAGIVLAAGVLVVKMYIFEIKGVDYKIGTVILSSIQIISTVLTLCLPLMAIYLVLWVVMGLFFLFKQMPGFGDLCATVLSFGPFVLILASFSLLMVAVLALFFLTPHLALKKSLDAEPFKEMIKRVAQSVFSNSLLFFIGFFPVGVIFSLLCFGIKMTESTYFIAQEGVGRALQSIVMKVPFTLILTPFVLFFFNFSCESYLLSKRKNKLSIEDKKEEEKCLV